MNAIDGDIALRLSSQNTLCYSLRYISTYMHVYERTHVLRTHMMLRKI